MRHLNPDPDHFMSTTPYRLQLLIWRYCENTEKEFDMRTMACVFMVCAVISMIGCSSVFAPQPVGDTPQHIDPEEWEGTWLCHDHCVVARVLDEEKGLLRIAWIEGGDSLEYRTRDIQIRASGEYLFANFKAEGVGGEEEKEKEYYVWARVMNEEGQFLAWIPDPRKIMALVNIGKLPGKIVEVVEFDVRRKQVFLGSLTHNDLQRITSESEGVLFAWDRPLAAVRIAH
jgi:hypothetical protein